MFSPTLFSKKQEKLYYVKDSQFQFSSFAKSKASAHVLLQKPAREQQRLTSVIFWSHLHYRNAHGDSQVSNLPSETSFQILLTQREKTATGAVKAFHTGPLTSDTYTCIWCRISENITVHICCENFKPHNTVLTAGTIIATGGRTWFCSSSSLTHKLD